MAQFIPFAPHVEVNGQTILSFVNAIPTYKEAMLGILDKNNLTNIKNELWYSQKAWLNAFREINDKFGANTLFAIGKAIPESAIFPPEIKNLKSALDVINVAYHMNHQGGEIGYYKLLSYDANACLAFMECRNPYPSEFDRGIITTMARKFKPREAHIISVELDTKKPSRLNGAESCTYFVKW